MTIVKDEARLNPAPVPPARESGAGAPPTLRQYVSQLGYSAAGSEADRQLRGDRWRPWLVAAGFVVPLALLGLWWFLTEFSIVPAHRMPSPQRVLDAAIAMTADGVIFGHIAISTQRVVLGFLAGSLLGLALGAWVGLSKWGSAFLSPTVGAFRAVPSLAWVPLLVLYLGISEDSKVTLIAIGALFPVYTTVAGALRHVDPHLVELGQAFGLARLGLLARVQLPAVVPSIVSGLRLALAQAWLFLVAAELIASSVGLGFLLVDSQNNGRVDRLFLTIILLGVLGKTTDALIGLLERWLLKRWG